MGRWYNGMLNILSLKALLLLVVSICLTSVIGEGGEGGGTDGEISAYAEAGGPGYQWNETHNFTITDEELLVEEEYSVTICESVKWNTEDMVYLPTGHVFGELVGIQWNDEPTPMIRITKEDFKTYQQDGLNLTITVLLEYYKTTEDGEEEGRGAGNEPIEEDGRGENESSELRQTYVEITVRRPNFPPTPIVWLQRTDDLESNNDTTPRKHDMHVNEFGEQVYYIEQKNELITLSLDGIHSFDPDGDTVQSYYWDLDENGLLGDGANERDSNATIEIGIGEHTISFRVMDEFGMSETISISILVRYHHLQPDLIVSDIGVLNPNGREDFAKHDMVIIRALIRNIGEVTTDEEFEVNFYYRMNETGALWQELGFKKSNDPLGVKQLRLIEFEWDTGCRYVTPGEYLFRAAVDYYGYFNELREKNNQGNPSEVIQLNVCDCDYYDTNVSFSSITVNSQEIETIQPYDGCSHGGRLYTLSLKAGEVVYINITLVNTGSMPAKNVMVYYIINGVLIHYNVAPRIDKNGVGETLNFVFNGVSGAGHYELSFEIRDNCEFIEKYDNISFCIPSYCPPPPDPPEPEDDDEESSIIENLDLETLWPLFTITAIIILALVIFSLKFMGGGRSDSQNGQLNNPAESEDDNDATDAIHLELIPKDPELDQTLTQQVDEIK